MDDLRRQIATLEFENGYLKREVKSAEAHLKHMVGHQYHARAANDAGLLEALARLHTEQVQGNQRSAEQQQQMAMLCQRTAKDLDNLSTEMASLREELRGIKQYIITLDGTTCGVPTPASIEDHHIGAGPDHEELLDFGVTTIDDIEVKKSDWDLDLPELHASSNFWYQDAKGNKLHVPLSTEIEQAQNASKCSIHLIPRYQYQRLLNSACYTEDLDAEELDAHWATYAQRNGLLSAKSWREYYEELVRPAYLARVTMASAKSQVDESKNDESAIRVAEMWFDGQRAELEYEDKMCDNGEKSDVLAAQPATLVDLAKEKQLREAREFMATATRSRDRNTTRHSLLEDPVRNAVKPEATIMPTGDRAFVLLQGIPTTVDSRSIAVAFKPDGIDSVQVARTAGMETKPPIDTNSVYFVFKTGEAAERFFKKLAAHAPALHELHGSEFTFELSLHASDGHSLARCRV